MNIMVVSLIERTREIGILKALGMKSRTVLSIFLGESVIIGLIGAVIGIIAGYGLAVSCCTNLGFRATWRNRRVCFNSSVNSARAGRFFGVRYRRQRHLRPVPGVESIETQTGRCIEI